MNPDRPQPRGSGAALSAIGGVRDAFTLLEMVAVVGILALQAALLFPALGRARSTARSAWCLHNLRQWGQATCLYVADHDDALPPEGVPNPGEKDTRNGWYIQLPREMGIAPYHDMPWRTNAVANPGLSTWICPSNRRRSNGRNLFHYCLNQYVDGSGRNDAAVRLASIPEPARLVWLFDSKNLPAVGYWAYAPPDLHGGGAQFLFLDGHVQRVRLEEYWDSVKRRGHTNSAVLQWVP